jgi:hypothetical protein
VHEYLGAPQLYDGKSARYETLNDAGMIENLSKLGRCKVPFLEMEIG